MARLIQLPVLAARWLKADSQRGVTALEYGLATALLALILITGLASTGAGIKSVFQAVALSV
jgi:pilus assembly protein Flp/PilA